MSVSLHRPPTNLRLWERFQNGKCSAQEIAGNIVLQRWLRCRDAGLSADNPGEPTMLLDDLEQILDAFAPILAPGAPFEAFATEVAKAGYCGLLSDARGVVLSKHIAEPFAHTIAETRLVEGALWSEGARGTNGLGTTLAERAPVAVVGPEHYELRNHGLACYAAPVRDVRQRIVAVLDATGPLGEAGGFIHASVVATAAAIEALIVSRTYDAAFAGGLFELERIVAELPHAAMLLESTGKVRRSNRLFRTLPSAGLAHVLETLHTRLTVGTRLPARLDLPGSRGFALELEPIGERDDPFAAIVHLRVRAVSARSSIAARPLPAPFEAILGNDPTVEAARRESARFAQTHLPILLLGETGAGKEIFARAIRAASSRADAPFVAVNCGALTGSLLESELFGYAPGAFTGADPRGRPGKLATAHGGTLFLDEIGELTPPTQAALLRFLEDGTYYRVGEHEERRADVRLIAATSRDLTSLVSQGTFRRDLFFRIRGVVVQLPALRHRTDRRELATVLLERIAGHDGPRRLSPAALAWIDRHLWPGNVRELRSALEYAVVTAGTSHQVELWHLPVGNDEVASSPGDLRRNAERTALLESISQARGNVSDAARMMGVARSTLYRMMRRHKIAPTGSEN